MARSLSECKEKLMNKLLNNYEIDDAITYEEFLKKADSANIIIGKITDIETI